MTQLSAALVPTGGCKQSAPVVDTDQYRTVPEEYLHVVPLTEGGGK